MRDKLIRLQKLYIDQFQRLLIKMKESRYWYLSYAKSWARVNSDINASVCF